MSDLTRHADLLDLLLHLERCFGGKADDDLCDDKIQEHADGADALRRNAEKPVVGVVVLRSYELEINDIGEGENDTDNHAGDGAFAVHFLLENSHKDSREEGRCSEAKGERDNRRDIIRRMDPKVGGHDHSSACGDSSID